MKSDDPILTAYALGELDDAERARIAQLVAGDATLEREVQAIRAAADAVTRELQNEPMPSLSEEQRAMIDNELNRTPVRRRVVLGYLTAACLGAAAAIAVNFALASALHKDVASPRDTNPVAIAPQLNEHASGDDAQSPVEQGKAIAPPSPEAQRRTEQERAAEVQRLLQRAVQLRREQQNEQAMVLLDQVLFLDPNNISAQTLKEMIEDSTLYRRYDALKRRRSLEIAGQRVDSMEATTPYRDLLAHPADSTALTQHRLLSNGTLVPSARIAPNAGWPRNENVVREYDIRDLLTEIPDFKDAPEFALEAALNDGHFGPVPTNTKLEQTQYGRGQLPPDGNIFQATQHTVAAGETLTAIARKHYNDGNKWKLIANVNKIDNGDVLREGQELIIPPLPEEGRFHTEAYDHITDNPFLAAVDNPLSTFSIDVDTASYTNTRRMLTSGQLPPAGAVRIEEFINYFPYQYSPPADATPFAAHVEVAQCPWNHDHQLVRIGLKGKEIDRGERPASNIVYLIDVSGSMMPANKLPLLREAFKMMTRELRETDRVAIVVYAGSSGLVLDSTPGNEQKTILDAIDRLRSGGSTNGAQGIHLAYQIATDNFIEGGINRVILATDGDFNVGTTSRDELVRLIEEKRKSGVFLSVLAVGTGNVKDAMMEELSNKGNGNYAYLDSEREAHKVLVEQMSGTLVTIAKDVKIQVEFNPAQVAGYRLIGYENRMLAKEDFNNDKIDAGEIGAGHTVTALYEVVPVRPARLAGPNAEAEGDGAARKKFTPEERAEILRQAEGLEQRLEEELHQLEQQQELPELDPLKYQKPAVLTEAAKSGELLTLKLRYKQPDEDVSTKIEFPVADAKRGVGEASEDFRFAASVAAFGMILRDSPYKGQADLDLVSNLALGASGHDPQGYRAEFAMLVDQARALLNPVANQPAAPAE